VKMARKRKMRRAMMESRRRAKRRSVDFATLLSEASLTDSFTDTEIS
jgi:hypothetical protein